MWWACPTLRLHGTTIAFQIWAPEANVRSWYLIWKAQPVRLCVRHSWCPSCLIQGVQSIWKEPHNLNGKVIWWGGKLLGKQIIISPRGRYWMVNWGWETSCARTNRGCSSGRKTRQVGRGTGSLLRKRRVRREVWSVWRIKQAEESERCGKGVVHELQWEAKEEIWTTVMMRHVNQTRSRREKTDSRLRSLSEARIWMREMYQKLKRYLKREWAYTGEICRTDSRLEKEKCGWNCISL